MYNKLKVIYGGNEVEINIPLLFFIDRDLGEEMTRISKKEGSAINEIRKWIIKYEKNGDTLEAIKKLVIDIKVIMEMYASMEGNNPRGKRKNALREKVLIEYIEIVGADRGIKVDNIKKIIEK